MATEGEAWQALLASTRTRLADQFDGERLDEEVEREARLEWIYARWPPSPTCEVCGNTTWTVSDPGDVGPQALAYPVTCRYCGNTKLLVPDITDLDSPNEGLRDLEDD